MNTQEASKKLHDIHGSICQRFIGKDYQVKLSLISFFSGLHLLVEDRPGVGKTTLAHCLSITLGMDFGRIQFTPDLLPGDITGMNIWDDQKKEFHFSPGPVFHSFLLADELNRAASRTQSALLEAMQENQVTTDDVTRPLPEDFFVMATQNPSQYSGTFALPEAQLDRFGLSFSLGWPDEQWESKILTMYKSENPTEGLTQQINADEIKELRSMIRNVKISDELAQWLVKLGSLTRSSNDLKNGFSTRGLQHLLSAAQGHALWEGRDFIIPEDIVDLAPWVGRHKLQVTAEMKMDGRQADYVIRHLQKTLEIPA